MLILVLAFAVGIAHFARLVGLKEQDLAEALIRVNPCR